MPHKPATLLDDIRVSAERVIEFTRSKSLEEYQQNEMMRLAVERLCMIIGKALVRLRTVAPDVLNCITDYQKIVGFRNILVHGYEIIEDSTVWYTIHNHLPLLLREVQALLTEAVAIDDASPS